MVFCNKNWKKGKNTDSLCHNPYFSRWFSAIWDNKACSEWDKLVTILILVDGFLQ